MSQQVCFYCDRRGQRHAACPYPAWEREDDRRVAQLCADREMDRRERKQLEQHRQDAEASERVANRFQQPREARGRSRLGCPAALMHHIGRHRWPTVSA